MAGGSNLGFQQLAPAAAAPATVAELVEVLSKALAGEGLAQYFTRRNSEAAERLWAEVLRLALAAAGPASTAPQLYFLSDQTTAAVMHRWPEDRGGWHPYGVLLRLTKLTPMGKWRALREALLALERQKAAFARQHGPFLYLLAVGTQEDFRGAGLGSMLVDRCCREADRQQRCIYVEATSDAARGWLKRLGFAELMRHVVRPHAPPVCVMVRRPRAPAADEEPPAVAAAAQGTRRSSAGRDSWTSGGQRASSGGGGGGGGGADASGVQQPRLRPAGSVRSR